jgi:hypothetical protein
MAIAPTALTAFDSRPFFDKALRYGVEHEIISPSRLQVIQADFAKGIVQIAGHFGTAHLRPELELALRRMVNLISLYLEESCGGDLPLAATSLRDKTLLSHSKGGSDMLKRLHALPECTLISLSPVSAEDQRAYLDKKTEAGTISLSEYLLELAAGQKNQRNIDFAIWLARKMGAARDALDNEDADALIRSAMLVLFSEKPDPATKPALPTRTAFVRLVYVARNAKTKLDEARMKGFLKDAPTEFAQLAQSAMQRFIEIDLPKIRTSGITADKLAQGDILQFFLTESADEDIREYVRLVAKEWNRVTAGEIDDPEVLATVFFLVASGFPPKASLLLREAKEVVAAFRMSGFDSQAVIAFIDNHAPESLRDDFKNSWHEDFRHEAEVRLADNDPNWPDAHMERALEYLRTTCRAAWKGRGR